jgi:hypothetical protein
MSRMLLIWHLEVDNPAETDSVPPEVRDWLDDAYESVKGRLLHLHPRLKLEDIQEVTDE